MTINEYISNLNKKYLSGIATEHTYRSDLEVLLKSILDNVDVTNEARRQECGAPDYILTRKDIPFGYIEAKDIGNQDLEGKKKTGNKEQFDRYKSSLNNLIFTDYIDFHFYRDGNKITDVKIAEVTSKGIIPLTDNFDSFDNLIKNFSSKIDQTIKSPEKLAKMMAGKARLLGSIIENALNKDLDNNSKSELVSQMTAFKDILIHDITPKAFSDVYAQTIAYGLFAARLHDPTLDTFSRDEAARLIPKTNPFLRKLFHYIAGPDLDDRILWVVDDLIDVFLACNVKEILSDYGKSTKMEDPIIHFYETFLSEYDPKLRKSRGVWYTPAPVVNFIVRAVDDILKEEFGLKDGLADNSKIKIRVENKHVDKRTITNYKIIEEEVHKVQILDPATGTGTFLAEVVKHIHKKFVGQEGIWSNYVEKDLIPRLNGFEILMASYAMAHLKLDLLFSETGHKSSEEQRFRVFLTNTLEEYHPDTGTLFASWLSSEANEANHIKRDTPVMCIIGNPPYAVSSSNASIDSDGNKTWIGNLISDYKKVLNERKINLDDDYIKFIRYGQYLIDKNGEGVLAYISNNSFIDGITHRQMRKNLLETFDKIYILDLHGNSKKKEKDPNGGADENVFDIQQGVSINIFIKSKAVKKAILHFDLFGRRKFKYEFLNNNILSTIQWNDLKADLENCFFTNKDFTTGKEYLDYISLSELFELSNSGIQTKCDSISVSEDINQLKKTVSIFQNESIETLKDIFKRKESSGWNYSDAKADLLNNSNLVYARYNYRPFDFRNIVYTGNSSGFIGRSRSIVMMHFINKPNLGLCLMRQFFQDAPYSHIYATNSLIDERTMYSNRGGTYLFPLYLYPKTKSQLPIEILDTSSNSEPSRQPNLDKEIVNEISKKLNLTFTNEKEDTEGTFAPIDILDYIYAILHSPAYREKYKEFLKIDFPRVPYPKAETFWKLVKIGGQIRQLHLLESPVLDTYITKYPIKGDNVVEKPIYKDGNVYINNEQYFEAVPEVAWNFYIGGYQPAQKWLKDRKGRELDFNDIIHYQKMIKSLFETDRLMKEIDNIGVE